MFIPRVSGNGRHVDVGRGHWIALVAVGVAVEDDDGHRGVASSVEWLFAAPVCLEVRAEPGEEPLVEDDHGVIVRSGAEPTRR